MTLVYTSGEPKRPHMITTRFALITGLLLNLGGCMTNATVEMTKTPFDATTQLTDGTTGSTKEFFDPTTEFTSSTTPGVARSLIWCVGRSLARLSNNDGSVLPHALR